MSKMVNNSERQIVSGERYEKLFRSQHIYLGEDLFAITSENGRLEKSFVC